MAKSNRGGKRPGAGRKVASPDGPAVVVTASVSAGLVRELDALSEREGWNRSNAVTEAVRRLLKSAHRQARNA
jgi:hypothetical protein